MTKEAIVTFDEFGCPFCGGSITKGKPNKCVECGSEVSVPIMSEAGGVE